MQVPSKKIPHFKAGKALCEQVDPNLKTAENRSDVLMLRRFCVSCYNAARYRFLTPYNRL